MMTTYYKPFYLVHSGMRLIFPASRKFHSLDAIQKLIPHTRYVHNVQFPRTKKYQIQGHWDILVMQYIDTPMGRATRLISVLPRISNGWIDINCAKGQS